MVLVDDHCGDHEGEEEPENSQECSPALHRAPLLRLAELHREEIGRVDIVDGEEGVEQQERSDVPGEDLPRVIGWMPAKRCEEDDEG